MSDKIKKVKTKKRLGSYPYFSVVLSITLALFVIGLFALLLLHARKLTSNIKENIEIQVYLNRYITENEKIKINKTLSDKDFVFVKGGDPQIQFISKEEAAEVFIKETGEDFINFLGENPLRDAFTIKLNPAFHEASKLAEVKKEIESVGGVFEVAYIESFISSINKNMTKLSIILAGFALILLFSVIMLINNTIKLALFSQRFLIRSMQLVGATANFIQRPFLFRALMHGIIAGIVASFLLFATMQYANNEIPDLEMLQDSEKILLLYLGLIIMGAIIGFTSTYLSINKYLKMSLEELY